MKSILFVLLILASTVSADSIDTLLTQYAKNSDLSESTKKENSGHLIVYTRDDIERMQARNLKDIMKSFPIVGYKENRYGLPDQMNFGGFLPSKSSLIRVFIDDQEMTTSLYGSGLAHMGDIDIGFVDHIEIYALNPSYEYTTEATYIMVKLYSKVPQRDRGGKVSLSYGSNGFNEQSIYHTGTQSGYDYLMYLNRLDDKRDTYPQTPTSTLSKDQERIHLFSTLKKDDYKFQLEYIDNDKDTFIGRSLSATPISNNVDYEVLNLGFNTTFLDSVKYSFSYNHINSDLNLQHDNDVPLLGYAKSNTTDKQIIATHELKYHLNSEDNDFLVGAKYRSKKLDFTNATRDGVSVPIYDYTKQKISTLFLENNYLLNENNIITFGAQYSHQNNNGLVKDYDLQMFRLGHTYNAQNFVFKTYVYQTETTVPMYVYHYNNSGEDYGVNQFRSISEEIKYKDEKHDIQFMFNYSHIKNEYLEAQIDNQLVVTTYPGKLKSYSTYYLHRYDFDMDNSLTGSINYNTTKGFQHDGESGIKMYGGFLRSLNTVGKVDIFNELVYRKDNFYNSGSYDYSAGVKYMYNNDITFSLKGENLLDKGEEGTYQRISLNMQTFQPEQLSDLKIPYIDRRVYFTMEVLF